MAWFATSVRGKLEIQLIDINKVMNFNETQFDPPAHLVSNTWSTTCKMRTQTIFQILHNFIKKLPSSLKTTITHLQFTNQHQYGKKSFKPHYPPTLFESFHQTPKYKTKKRSRANQKQKKNQISIQMKKKWQKLTWESKPKFREKDLDSSALTTNLTLLLTDSFLLCNLNLNPKPHSLVSLLWSLELHNIPVAGEDNRCMSTNSHMAQEGTCHPTLFNYCG